MTAHFMAGYRPGRRRSVRDAIADDRVECSRSVASIPGAAVHRGGASGTVRRDSPESGSEQTIATGTRTRTAVL